MRESDGAEAPASRVSVSAAAVVVLCAAATLALGVLPGRFLEAAKGLAAALL
jgi:hypothetical protein